MLRRVLFVVPLLALASGALAQAQAQRATNVRAGIVVIDSDQASPGVPANRAPHVWFNLDQNRVKPVGLNILNPARQTMVTNSIAARWPGLTVGNQISKRDAPYWEIFLSTLSDEHLGELDILLLAAHGNVSLNPLEREKLRRFMDKGGVLWVDIRSTGNFNLDPINNLPLPFVPGTTGSVTGADFFHPLLSYPMGVSNADLSFMQSDGTYGVFPLDLNALGYGQLEGILQPLRPDSLRLQSIAQDNRGPYVVMGRVGNGYMVVTSRGVATTLNRLPDGAGGYQANTGSTSGQYRPDRSSDAAARLVLNMLHLVSGHPQPGGGSRQTGGGPIDLGAPVLQRFNHEIGMAPPTNRGYFPPVVHKGLLIVSAGNRLFVYDADPRQDLDVDGDPDDGVRDYSLGSSHDLLWASAPMSGTISAPTVIEVAEATPEMRDQIVVVDSSGTLRAFSAFQWVNGRINPSGSQSIAPSYSVSPPSPANFGAGDGGGPYAPTFHEGFLYIADAQSSGLSTVGRLWVVDPVTQDRVVSGANGGAPFVVGGVGTGVIPEVSAPATVGYVPIQDNSGGLDKVAYLATRPNPSGAGPNSTAGITSLWIGARGERPSSWSEGGGVLTVATRASGQGLEVYVPTSGADARALGVKLTVLRPNGDPLTPAEMDALFTGSPPGQAGGVLTFPMETGAVLPPGASIRIDYHINWGTGPAATGQIVRGQAFLPDDASRSRRILHRIAMSPKGTIYAVTGTQNTQNIGTSGGSYFAIREEGRGTFRVLTRWDLYNQHTINLNQAAPVTYPETLFNRDPLVTNPAFGLSSFLGGTLQNLTFMSGPSVQGNVVYVMARGVRQFGFFQVPFTILLAFDAEPSTIEIRTGDLGAGFAILQPDVLRSSNKSAPEVYTTLQANQYVYDRDAGQNRGIIRIDNLSGTTRGPLLNTLSTSQPIVIRRGGQPDVLVEPNTTGSRWSPLLWYTIFTGFGNDSPVFLSGDTLFMAGASMLPNFLTFPFGTAITMPPAGTGVGMETQISPNDPYLVPDPVKPWQRQLYQLRINGNNLEDIESNPAFRWPQTTGVTSFDEWRIRILQSTLRRDDGTFSSTAHGLIGGDGGLFAWSDDGIWGFAKADFIVADEGRVGRFDSAGNPQWSLTNSLSTGVSGDVGGAGNVRPLVRPTRAYQRGEREVVVVDTGANRIVRMDTNGREVRSIEGFRLDPSFRPAGFDANAPTTFNAPRDVTIYTQEVAAANNQLSNPTPLEFWVHYLIADTGNRRIVEVVDRFAMDPTTRQLGDPVLDGSGNRAVGVLLWHSPATHSGRNFDYTSLARIYIPGSPGRWVYAAGIGGTLPTRADTGLDAPTATAQRQIAAGNGGIVVFDGQNTQIVNEVMVPAVGANVFYNEQTGTFNSPAQPARMKALNNVTSVTMRNTLSGLQIMFADAEGVYEIEGGGPWTVRWMLPRQAYTAMRRNSAGDPTVRNPMDFRPMYARRLESGEVLVVNGYVGAFRRADANDPWRRFTGEVLQVDGDIDATGTAPFGFNFNKLNLGFRSLSIRFQLPPIAGARDMVSPTFADRR
jgi:hypothetical protein